MPKHFCGHIRTALSAYRIIRHYKMIEWRPNTRMKLCACAAWIWICASVHFRLARPNYSYSRCIHRCQLNAKDESSFLKVLWLFQTFILDPLKTQMQSNCMTKTSLGPWKLVLNMGSSSHWELIIARCQEANSDNLGMPFLSSIKLWCICVLIRI